MNFLNGYKTYAAAGLLVTFGVYQIATGDTPGGMQHILGGMALVGLGHKLDKNTAAATAIAAPQSEEAAG